MNTFLNKWLEYLVGQGHAPETLVALPFAPSDAPSAAFA
jgi:hypothetical protein